MEQQVEFTMFKILLLKSAMDESTVQALKCFVNDYSEPTRDTPTKKMNFYPDIMRHKGALFKRVTLLPFTPHWIILVTNISGLIHVEPKHSVCTCRRVGSENRI